MARSLKSADIQTITTNALTELDYTVPSGTVSTAYLTITNQAATNIKVDVYINDSSADYLIASRVIPAGIGKVWRVFELSDQNLNTGFGVKVKSDINSQYTAFLSVSELV